MYKRIRYMLFFIVSMINASLPSFAFISNSSDSLKTDYKMGFFDLYLGPDFRNFKGAYSFEPSLHFTNNAILITARMQNSFLGNYILNNRSKRFKFGDVLAGELSPGIVFDKTSQHNTPGIAYRFEFGFGAIMSVNYNNDIGVTFAFLKFARDRVSPNISGSNILLRYRYKRAMVEGGIEARRDRIFGWANFFNSNNILPVQYTITTRYLINNNKNIGLKFEYMRGESGKNYISDLFILRNLWSLKLFYGIYF